jgi:hypothetical protein
MSNSVSALQGPVFWGSIEVHVHFHCNCALFELKDRNLKPNLVLNDSRMK